MEVDLFQKYFKLLSPQTIQKTIYHKLREKPQKCAKRKLISIHQKKISQQKDL